MEVGCRYFTEESFQPILYLIQLVLERMKIYRIHILDINRSNKHLPLSNQPNHFLGSLLLRGVVQEEMHNSLKWPRCSKVSSHKTSNALWKLSEVFLLRIWLYFFNPKISTQTRIFSSWLLFRKVIISQLELRLPVDYIGVRNERR